MRKNEVTGKQELLFRAKISVVAAGAAVLMSILFLLFMSFLIQGEIVPYSARNISSLVVITVFTFLAALFAIRMNTGKTLISGLSVSAVVILLLIIGSLFFDDRGELRLAVLVSAAAAGAVAGLVGGRKRKIR